MTVCTPARRRVPENLQLVSRKRRLLRSVVAGLVAIGMSATLVSLVVPDAVAASPGPQIGAVVDLTWGTSAAQRSTTVTSMATAGIGWARANVSWSGGEPTAKGVLNENWLVQVDAAVAQARAAGIQVLMPIADGVPYWASADPAKYTDASGPHWNQYWRPTNAADYASFVRAMVNRYKVMGVHTYEVWNEPNLSRFWPSGPDAKEYTTLLAAAYPVIKAADPAATVILGGLSKSDYDYLGQLYAAGAGPYFDAVAVHPYTGSVDPTWCWNEGTTTRLAKDAFCGIEEVRNTMVAAGDSAKRIWLTELGWSTTTGAYGVSEAAQADYLTKALDKIRSSYPYVAAAFWYNLRNNFWQNDQADDFEANLGLLRVDFTPKAAYAALKSWTGGAVSTTTTAPPTTATTPAPVPLKLSKVTIHGINTTSVTLRWTTNVISTSQVDYGTLTPVRTVTDPTRTTTHSVTLSGLSPRTRYVYRVQSADAGNVAISPIYSFTTAKR